jgi:hypothetical protein
MTSSGTTTFDLQIDEALEEAFELVGGEYTSAEEARSARRSLNLVLKDLENRGIPLAKLELKTFTVTQSTETETLPSDVIDVLDVVCRRSGVDYSMNRLSVAEYNSIPDKTQEGRPFSFMIDRQQSAPIMYLYLTPENSTDVVRYWAITKIDDVTASNQTIDVDARYLPALTMGLAYHLSFKRQEITEAKRAALKQNYEELIARALLEDSERVSFRAVPSLNTP